MAVRSSLYDESGRPQINHETCTACGACVRTCPADVLSMDEGRVRANTTQAFGCIACGHCMMVCLTGSIRVSGRGVSEDDLVDLASLEHRSSPDQLESLLLARRSVRHFAPREVDSAVLDHVLEMAATAPMGIPPSDVGVTVVRGRKNVQKLAGEIVRMYEQASWFFSRPALVLMRPFIGRAAYESYSGFVRPLARMLVDARRKGQDVLFWDAPAVMIFHSSPYSDPCDASIACTYAMIAATSVGLGTCVIGSAAPVMRRSAKLKQAYSIPPGNKPDVMLILGYPDVPFVRGIRRRFASVNYC